MTEISELEAQVAKFGKSSVKRSSSDSSLSPIRLEQLIAKEKELEAVKSALSNGLALSDVENAAKNAKELVVAVSRIDTWKRNRNLIVEEYKSKNKLNRDVKIIAVSKTFPINQVEPLIKGGHIHFGENKVQEAEKKWTELKKTIVNTAEPNCHFRQWN